jgi:hypothetical protein
MNTFTKAIQNAKGKTAKKAVAKKTVKKQNSFVKAARSQPTRTTNGMKAFTSTANSCVDLFYNIAASRGKDIIPAFIAAYSEDPELAIRIALWARDARSGGGERQTFRNILAWLDNADPEYAARVLRKVPELGRFDDLLVVQNTRETAFEIISEALNEGNGLAAKWMPRKGEDAVALRKYLGYSPKRYRKTLVNLTQVVEQAMCAREWSSINYDHVPSVAAARYQKAFGKHDPSGYTTWKNGLVKGESKVNASVLYPYDVIRSIARGDKKVALAQWEALPNYLPEGASILPMVDVSGSMTCRAGGHQSKSEITCLDVALSLGLYLADKNTGAFQDTFLTFSSHPELLHLKGNLLQKMQQMNSSHWEMSTNLEAGFRLILDTAVNGNVPQSEMPQTVLILSDMQFNSCTRFNASAKQMMDDMFRRAGYKIPNIVFWNINAAYGNAPVQYDAAGVALVSGFSPSLMTSILSGTDFTPANIMLETVMKERYNF